MSKLAKSASFVAAVGLALSPFACGARVAAETIENADADVEGDSNPADDTSLSRDASLDGPRVDLDGPNDAWDVQADAMDAPGDVTEASQCGPDDPPPPVIPSNATITFNVVNTASVDTFVLTQATECSAYSIEGEQTLSPYPCGCQCALPPEQLYFTRLAPGASTTLTWDARALAWYYSYVDCRPNAPYCTSISHGSLQPVLAASYVIDVVAAASVPSGSGTNCALMSGGDVSCTILAQLQFSGRCDPSNIGLQTSTVRQSFVVPASGAMTVQVKVP